MSRPPATRRRNAGTNAPASRGCPDLWKKCGYYSVRAELSPSMSMYEPRGPAAGLCRWIHSGGPEPSSYQSSCGDQASQRGHWVSDHFRPQAGQTPRVSNVFQLWRQVHIHRSCPPGSQPHRGQRIRPRRSRVSRSDSGARTRPGCPLSSKRRWPTPFVSLIGLSCVARSSWNHGIDTHLPVLGRSKGAAPSLPRSVGGDHPEKTPS